MFLRDNENLFLNYSLPTGNWFNSCTHSECTLHQLSPYIGKLKSSIAHDLIDAFSRPGEMLGHGLVDNDYYYPLQTLKDNVSLFTPEVLDRINQVVVKAGHRLIYQKKRKERKNRFKVKVKW